MSTFNTPNSNRDLTIIDVVSSETTIEVFADAFLCITGMISHDGAGAWSIDQAPHAGATTWDTLDSGTGPATALLDYIHGASIRITIDNAAEAEVTIEGALK